MTNTINRWWNKLASRERRFVLVGAIVIALLCLYFLIIAPATSILNNTETKLISARALAQRLTLASAEIKQLRQSGATRESMGSQSLLTFVDNSLKQNNLNRFVTKMQQGTDRQQVMLHFKSVPFDSLVSWLIKIWQHYGIEVTTINVSATNKLGLTQVSMLLSH